MPDFSALPPPSAQQNANAWDAHLNTLPAVTEGLNAYRFWGYHTHQVIDVPRPVAVPHPQNRWYSSIETAKRKQAKENVWWQRKQMELHHRDIQQQKWIRPMSESAFQVHRPNIQNFGRVMKRGY